MIEVRILGWGPRGKTPRMISKQLAEWLAENKLESKAVFDALAEYKLAKQAVEDATWRLTTAEKALTVAAQTLEEKIWSTAKKEDT